MECKWGNTLQALGDLENLLTCGNCSQLVQNPVCLGKCEHFFCKGCSENAIGNTCPVCGIPSHVKDVTPNRQLETAVTLCQELSYYLLQDSFIPPGTPSSSQKVKDAPSPVKSCSSPSSRRGIATTEDNSGIKPLKIDGSPCNPKKKSAIAKAEMKVENIATSPRANSSLLSDISVPQITTPITQTKKKGSRVLEKPCTSQLRTPPPGNPKKKSTKAKAEKQLESELKVKTIPTTTRENSTSISESSVAQITTPLGRTKKKGVRVLEKSRTSQLRTPPPAARATKSEGKRNTSLLTTPVQESKPLNERSGRKSTPQTLQRTPHTQSTRSSLVSVSTPSPWKKNHKGESPLQVAVIKGDYDMVLKFLEEGAELNTKDNAGWTPLHEACNHGYSAITALLLDYGAFINIPGFDLVTPLHDAVENNRINIVKILVDRGADTSVLTNSGKRPIDLALTDEMRDILNSASSGTTHGIKTEAVPDSLLVPPPVIFSVGLSREEKAAIQKCAVLLNGRTVTEFSNQVTHLVTSVNRNGQCPRTLEFLTAVVNGKWIVTKEWVELCMEYGERVGEEAFEVPGCSNSPDSLAPKRAREGAKEYLPRLFDGCKFYLEGSFSYPTPAKNDLINLILQGGGKYLTQAPSPDESSASQTPPYHYGDTAAQLPNHFIVRNTKNTSLEKITDTIYRVPAEWILQCIAKFELLDRL